MILHIACEANADSELTRRGCLRGRVGVFTGASRRGKAAIEVELGKIFAVRMISHVCEANMQSCCVFFVEYCPLISL